MPLQICKLAPEHDRSRFHSGNADLDRFFTRYAGQNQFRHHIGTTYVALDEAGVIAGFATVAASELSPAVMPTSNRKRLPKYPLPVLRLARLAVDERFKGQGIGSLLLRAIWCLRSKWPPTLAASGWWWTRSRRPSASIGGLASFASTWLPESLAIVLSHRRCSWS